MHNAFMTIVFILSGVFCVPAVAQVDFFGGKFSLADAEAGDKKNWSPVLNKQRGSIYQSKSLVSDIVSKEPFVNIEQKKIWNFESEEEDVEDMLSDFSGLNMFIKFMAMMVEAALWILPVVIVFYLYRYREHWLGVRQHHDDANDKQQLPDTLFGLDMRRKNLPKNIEEAAKELWQNKKNRESISLLYRGALMELFRQYKFELPTGATEHDCLKYIKQSEIENGNNLVSNQEGGTEQGLRIVFFEYLTQVWVKTAYAHQLPDETVFERICKDWAYNFSDGKF